MAVSEAQAALVPHEVTVAIVEDELAAVTSWCSRWGWSVTVDLDSLTFTFTTVHPTDGRPILLEANVAGYRALPPAWRFLDEAGASTRSAFPAQGAGPGGSVFHTQPVICAPWNRLAYQDAGGPHDDWGGATSWLTVSGVTRATTIADMLAVVRVHLSASPGRMG